MPAGAIDALTARWQRLPGNVRGALWILAASFLASLLLLMAKALGSRLHPAQIAFVRALIAVAFIGPLLLVAPGHDFRTTRPFTHIAAGVFGVTSLTCFFFAVTRLNIADVTALAFTRTLFLIVLAVLFLGESVRIRRWSATGVGFIGVLVMIRPTGGIDLAASVALLGALSAAITAVLFKKLTRTEDPLTQLFYFFSVSAAVTLVPAVLTWNALTLGEFVVLVLLAAAGVLNVICFTLGVRIGEATAVIPVDYTRLLFAAALGFVFFAEVPDLWMWVGAALIVASTLYITHREARLRRVASDDAGGGARGASREI
jgi:drug/metabolite transporter (DMT)-like permease